MEEFIKTVRGRYGRQTGFHGLGALCHREKKAEPEEKTGDTEDKGTRSFLGLLRPQLQSVSKRLREEISKLFERRDKLLMQSVARDVPRVVGQHTEKLIADNKKSEKAYTEKTLRLNKRVELLSADTGARFKAAEREIERLKTAERNRTRDEAKRAREQPVIMRDARKNVSREIIKEREELRREMGARLQYTEKRITRRLREDEEYEKRRRG